MDARDINDPSELRLLATNAGRGERKPAVQSLFRTIWPFICIVVVLVAIALTDFLLDPADPFGTPDGARRQADRELERRRPCKRDIAQTVHAAPQPAGRACRERRALRRLAVGHPQAPPGGSRCCSRRKERAQVTLASIADAVVTVDTAGRIEFMNPVAERLTGWPLAEAHQRPVAGSVRLSSTRRPARRSPIRSRVR
jgi:PAS domain-containing protein